MGSTQTTRILIFVGLFILVVGTSSWFELKILEEQAKKDVSVTLETVLKTTKEAMNLWFVAMERNAKVIADQPETLVLTQELLRLPQTKAEIVGSTEIKKLRNKIEPFLKERNFLGFFIISPNYLSIASMRDENIGTINFLSKEGDYLERIFNGEALVTLPIKSDVPLKGLDGEMVKGEPTMFAGAPIEDGEGNIIAALTVRINPSLHFTRIAQIAKMGETGDTYAFNNKGILVTESNFDDQLRELKLINNSQRGILSLRLGDPGGNLTEGYQPKSSQNNWPLTLMAQNAVLGTSGINLAGYRDYRGVSVVGAWLWDQELNLGIANEMDVAESYASFYFTRTIIISIVLVIVFLFLGFSYWIIRHQKQLSAEIVDRKEAEDELRKLSVAVEQSPVIVLITNLQGDIEYVNPKFEEMTGYRAQEVLGENPRMLKSDKSSSEEYEKLWKTITAGKEWRGEFQNMKKNGDLYWEAASISPIMSFEGTITHFVWVKEDITERKKAEEELKEARKIAVEANQAKSDFLASMSHELRTPLNGILGYAQILKRDVSLSEKQKSGVDVIQRSGDHLLTLINDILDLSKIEAQKLELQLTEFHLPDFLQQIASIIRVRAEQADLSFVYEAMTDLPMGVQGDEKRLRQVLLNLLGNALKYTEKGKVTLKVGYDDASTFPDLLRFQVEDTGRGIPQDQLEGIFQPFQQVKNQSQHIEGTGLGLPITQKLVTLMGGELGVTSTPGKGSTFWFTVRLPAVETSQIQALPVDKTIIGYKGERKRILVVDDKPTNRSIAVHLLEPLGFEVQEAENGQEALAKIAKSSPHLILMDLIMPVMDGIEATRRIRQLPEGNDVPIIASSASVFEFNQQDSFKAGCNDFLPKPVKTEQLFRTIEKHLKIEWEYQEPHHQKGGSPEEPQTLVIPPSPSLSRLVQLAQKGQIVGVREEISHIEQMGEEYGPFVQELRIFSKAFQLKELSEFVKPFLEKME